MTIAGRQINALHMRRSMYTEGIDGLLADLRAIMTGDGTSIRSLR